MDNKCVVCGAIIPEGRQVCPNCENSNKKQIHIYYINKIKNLDMKIFDYEDDEYPNYRAVQICERNIEKWLDKAGITDEKLRREIRGCCSWSNDACCKLLKSKGWEILVGEDNLK